jgi:hypothetical protein
VSENVNESENGELVVDDKLLVRLEEGQEEEGTTARRRTRLRWGGKIPSREENIVRKQSPLVEVCCNINGHVSLSVQTGVEVIVYLFLLGGRASL